MNTIGTLIRDAREAAGLTQRTFAKALGVSHVFVCHVENGRKNFPAARFTDLLSLLPALDPERVHRLMLRHNRRATAGAGARALARYESRLS